MRVAESNINNSSDGSKLYKTEMCRSWEESGSCRYGTKCQFAHGKEELRPVARHPKYKTEVCRTFTAEGACPYGRRCRFIHPMFDSSSSARSQVVPLMNSFTRYLDDMNKNGAATTATPSSSKARLPVFRQICPAPSPSLVY